MKISNKKNNSEMWLYLDALGILETGTEEEIKAAKKLYRKNYLLKYKQHQRASRPEITIPLSKDNGDYSLIAASAKKHKMSIIAFIRSAAKSYINKTYIVPDKYQVAEIELSLANCLNEIQTIARRKERLFFDREQKYQLIEKRIEKLSSEINSILRYPSTIEELLIKEIKERPMLKERLLFILNNNVNDNQNKIT